MGVIKKQGIITSVVLYASTLLGFVVTLYFFPKYLTAEEIGLTRVFTDIALLLAPFVLLGVPNTFVRYYPYFKNSEEMKAKLRLLSVLISAVGGTIVLLLFTLFFEQLKNSFMEKSALLTGFLHLVPLLIVIFSLRQLIAAYYRSELNTIIPNIYEEFVQRILISLVVVAYFFFGFDVSILVYFWISLNALVLLFMALNYRVIGSLKLAWSLEGVPRDTIREMLIYGLFVIATRVSSSLIVKIDTWMLSSMSGLNETGVYYIALSIGVLVELPKRSISQIAMPVLSSSWKNNNIENIQMIYHKTSLNQLLASGLLFILVITNLKDLFDIIPNGNVYRDGVWVVYFIGLGKLFAVATGSNIEILQMSKHFRMTLYVRMFLVVIVIVSNLIFIPLYGISGAAFSTSLSYLLFNIVLFFYLYFKLKLQPFRMSNLIALGILLAIYFPFVYLDLDFGSIVNIGLRSFLIIAAFSVLVLTTSVSEDANLLYKQVLRRIKR